MQIFLKKYIDLFEPCLSHKEKENVYVSLIKHKDALSFRDEISKCPNMEVELN